MRGPHRSRRPPTATDLEAALATLPAETLREVVREVLLELDDRAHARAASAIIARAARAGSGWAPASVGDGQVERVLSFVLAAKRRGQAEPAEVDARLSLGSMAFLRGDYAAAREMLGALLAAIGDGDVDLGQDELVEEVLGTDTVASVAQYVVSAYMTAAVDERPEAVRSAIEAVQGVELLLDPLDQMESVAVEPLPDLPGFLRGWRALLSKRAAEKRRGDWDTHEDRWLREVVHRLAGAAGLAELARASRRADDLRDWCASLVEARDWGAALAAFTEAAALVADGEYARGEFLDGAALASQMLGHKSLPQELERAWRGAPSAARLRRWLGSSTTKATLGKRVTAALAVCPESAARQRALLHLLSGDFAAAARLLAAAPGQAWSNPDHPGHLLFPLFARLLGGGPWMTDGPSNPIDRGMDLDELEALAADHDEPRLVTPDVEQLLDLAGVDRIGDAAARAAALAAMKRAAERRLAAVTSEQRRGRHYEEAARLVGICVACDPGAVTARWAAALEADYRRYPALKTAFARALGPR